MKERRIMTQEMKRRRNRVARNVNLIEIQNRYLSTAGFPLLPLTPNFKGHTDREMRNWRFCYYLGEVGSPFQWRKALRPYLSVS
jgi:hypothetical protein